MIHFLSPEMLNKIWSGDQVGRIASAITMTTIVPINGISIGYDHFASNPLYNANKGKAWINLDHPDEMLCNVYFPEEKTVATVGSNGAIIGGPVKVMTKNILNN